MSGVNGESVSDDQGHVISQDGGSDGPDEGSQHADELEAARAAVRKAIAKEAGEDGAAKAKEAEAKRQKALKAKSDREDVGDDEPEEKPEPKKAAPPPKKEEDTEVDPTKASLKEVLKNREKLARTKQQQSVELQQQQQYISQMQAQIQAERRAIEQEKQRLALLKRDPVKAITEAGWDPDDLILSIAQEGTPEGKMARMVREQQMQLAQMQAWRDEQLRQQQSYQEQIQQHQMIQARQNVEQTFIKGALNAEKYPHLADFYSGREGTLIAEGDLVAGQFRDLTGREATLEEIAEYIEEQLAERANLWYEKKRGAGTAPTESRQVATPKDSGKPARGGAKGRTLTGSATSERRALSKDLKDLDGDERLLAAREAVKVALATARED